MHMFFALIFGCTSSETQSPDALLAEQLVQEQAAHQAQFDSVAASPTGKDIASAIAQCLDREASPPYALELSIWVHDGGVGLQSLSGASPLLSEAIQQTCIHSVLHSAQITPLPALQAPDATAFEGHDITIFRPATGETSIQSAPILRFAPTPETQHQEMTPASDFMTVVGTSTEQ